MKKNARGMKKNARGLFQKQITIEVNGVKKQKAFYAKTVPELNKKLLAYRGEVEKGRSFKVVAEEWAEEHYKTLASNSLKNIIPAVARAIDEFGNISVKNITPLMINNFILKFSKGGYAQKTVATQLQVIRQILGYATLCGETQYNSALSVSVPKNLPKTKREVPTAEEIDVIKNNPNATFALFALFALYTGCRRGELLALTYDDIDFDNKLIHISKSLYHIGDKPFIKEPKTQAGNRNIDLLPQLEQHIPPKNRKGFVFNVEGKLITNRKFITLWDKYQSETGLSITPHQLRHAFATRLYELDIDVKSAQYLLGHADVSTMQNIYTHIRENKRVQITEKMQDF